MHDRLTLTSTPQPGQATDLDDRPSRAPGKRQPQELQTAFLDGILHQLVTVYLVNGIKLSGKVRQHDQYTLLLQQLEGIDSLIFKHAISTLIPGAPAMTRERRTPFGKRPAWTG